MKWLRIPLAIILILLPVAGRTLWFYRGVYQRTTPVSTPDYASMTIPQPPVTDSSELVINTQPAEKTVLVDLLHQNNFLMTEIDPLTRSLTERGAAVRQIDGSGDLYLEGALKFADSLVVVAPTIPFTPSEVSAVASFVNRGGHLLVILDPTRNVIASDFYSVYFYDDDVVAANLLLAPFNVIFNADYAYNTRINEGNFRNIILEKFSPTDVTNNVSKVVFYAARTLNSASDPLIAGDESTLSSLNNRGGGLAVGALAGNGNLMALGDLTFMTTPYIGVADNRQLTYNISDFLLNGERTRNLDDFPYLFTRQVSVLVSDKISLDSDFLAAFATLQSSLRLQNINIQLVQKPVDGTDLIVLGTYEHDPAISLYIRPFDINLLEIREDLVTYRDFPDDPDLYPKLDVPEMGKITLPNTGMLLYQSGKEQNVLVVLAIDNYQLFSLTSLLGYGDLSTCVLNGVMAVCSLSPIAYG